MNKVKNLLWWLWSAPATVFLSCWIPAQLFGTWAGVVSISALTIFVVLPTPFLAATKQLRWRGWYKCTMEFDIVNDSWLDKKFFKGKWAGVCSGWYIWYAPFKKDSDPTIKHERRHADQFRIFGIFQPVIYVALVIFTFIGFRDLHPYYDNFFEWDARRHAGQPLDIPWQKWTNKDGETDRWIWW